MSGPSPLKYVSSSSRSSAAAGGPSHRKTNSSSVHDLLLDLVVVHDVFLQDLQPPPPRHHRTRGRHQDEGVGGVEDLLCAGTVALVDATLELGDGISKVC